VALRDEYRVSQGFAREQRNRETGRTGCDDCGVRHYWRVNMIGTGAAVRRLCSECMFHRGLYSFQTDGDWNG
jgi:hypothetical protein